MAMGVTARANELLAFIGSYQDHHNGMSPSVEEMTRALGLISKNHPHKLLLQLEERGRIKRLHYRARAIEIVGRPAVPLVDMRSMARFEHLVWDNEEKILVPLAAPRNRE